MDNAEEKTDVTDACAARRADPSDQQQRRPGVSRKRSSSREDNDAREASVGNQKRQKVTNEPPPTEAAQGQQAAVDPAAYPAAPPAADYAGIPNAQQLLANLATNLAPAVSQQGTAQPSSSYGSSDLQTLLNNQRIDQLLGDRAFTSSQQVPSPFPASVTAAPAPASTSSSSTSALGSLLPLLSQPTLAAQILQLQGSNPSYSAPNALELYQGYLQQLQRNEIGRAQAVLALGLGANASSPSSTAADPAAGLLPISSLLSRLLQQQQQQQQQQAAAQQHLAQQGGTGAPAAPYPSSLLPFSIDMPSSAGTHDSSGNLQIGLLARVAGSKEVSQSLAAADSTGVSSLSSIGEQNASKFIPDIPPYYDRDIMTLSLDNDTRWLSEYLCFIRKHLVEVFTATDEDVRFRTNSKKIQIGQVGIRCRFCAHININHAARAGRSQSFPSSLSRIYQSLTMMLREHFPKCTEMPAATRALFELKKMKSREGSATDSRTYWIEAAIMLGMVDTDGHGIRFKEKDENEDGEDEEEEKEGEAEKGGGSGDRPK